MRAEINKQDGRFTLWFARMFFSLDERISFFDRLADLLDANFSLRGALEAYYQGFSQKLKKDDSRLVFLRDVLGSLAAGDSFSVALSPWVGSAERILLEAGEKSGSLGQSLRSCGNVAKNARDIRQAIRASLINPAINGAFFIGTAIYYAVALMPGLAKMSDPGKWTGLLYLWYVISEWLRAYSLAAGLFFVVFTLAARFSMSRLRPGHLRDLLDKFPPWNIYLRIQGAVILTSIAAMLKSGMTMRATLERIQSQSSPYLADKMDQMISRLAGENASQGEIAEVFDVNLLAPEEVVEIGIYAQTKTLSESLTALADHNTRTTMKWIESRIEGVGFFIDMLAAAYTTISLLALMGLAQVLGGGAM